MKMATKSSWHSKYRSAVDQLATGLAIAATLLVVAPLVAIFIYLIYKGASSLNLDFFTHVPKPVGETGGGMANAIAGTGVILAIALQILMTRTTFGFAARVTGGNARAALAIADRGAVIENGRIVLEGPASALLHAPDIAERYLGVGVAATADPAEVARMASRLRACVWDAG